MLRAMERLKELLASDIPFARDDAHRLLPAMVACLVGFAALLLALAVSLSDSVAMQARDVTGVLQVEIPADAIGDADKAAALVRKTPGVRAVTVLRQRDMESLLKPWLGDGFTLDELPVPTLLDVKTEVKDNRSVVDVKALQTSLRTIDRSITVQDRGPWAQQMTRATGLLKGLVLLVAFLLLACVTGMIVLVARTNLKLHFKAVSLLHMFGATDEYILRQFQWNNAALAGRGALVGSLFAGLVFTAWVVLSHRWESPVLPPVSFGLGHAVTFVVLPLATAAIAFAATRVTVQSMLRHMH